AARMIVFYKHLPWVTCNRIAHFIQSVNEEMPFYHILCSYYMNGSCGSVSKNLFRRLTEVVPKAIW
ncbi:MAG: hypothetical protein PHY43_10585, partial [Verrucomicrobiales bacterium]|nr:hypothetical protein [Verrucomicrobiales bacterium]